MANLSDGDFGRSPYILQRLKRAVSLAAAEDRGVVRPEPEQVLVSVVALDENALHLSLTLHRSPLICKPFIWRTVADAGLRYFESRRESKGQSRLDCEPVPTSQDVLTPAPDPSLSLLGARTA